LHLPELASKEIVMLPNKTKSVYKRRIHERRCKLIGGVPRTSHERNQTLFD